MPAFAIHGHALHTPARDRLEAWPDALIEVDAAGRIAGVQSMPAAGARADAYAATGRLIELGPRQLLLPGLIDLHIHAPQWPQLGTALDRPLERWLQDDTFPLEARFADTDYAAAVYAAMVPALLANGTTTAVYYGSRHLPATQLLAEICLRHGQRAFVGRVAMDHPAQCPPGYRDQSAELAEAETRALIAHIRALPGNASALVQPVITPRFIPACTDDLLARLGALARETGCHVQTHCSESDWEHRHVLQRCGMTDTAALRHFGLLHRRTVLAHGNFVDDADLALMHAAGAGIAHCPLSNAYFAGAVFPLRAALARVHIGLGTDIAGGASPSMLDSARMAITAARMLESGVDPALPASRRGRDGARIDAVAAFWLATAGGGIVLDQPVGTFAPGQHFDALLLDLDAPDGNIAAAKHDPPLTLLERVVHTAQRSDIRRVWVGGRVVHERPAAA